MNEWFEIHDSTMIGLRKYSTKRPPTFIITLASVVCFVMIVTAYIYSLPTTPSHPEKCSFYSSEGCRTRDLFPNAYFSRELTDQEIESRVVVKELLNFVPLQTTTPKVAFMFMTPGSLPFEKLWHLFFQVSLYIWIVCINTQLKWLNINTCVWYLIPDTSLIRNVGTCK